MKTLLPKSISGLETVLNRKFTHHQFGLNCADMLPYEKYNRERIRKGNITDLFNTLAKIKTPIIYWFEFSEASDTKPQVELLEKYRKQQQRAGKKKGRIVPLLNANGKGKILYVGKRLGGCSKKGFTYATDRIEMHLGYNPNGGNQGLQLCHWCNAELTVNIVELSKSAAPYLTAIEQLFAIELSPTLGRH